VGVKTLTDETYEVSEYWAAVASARKDAIVVLYNGTNEEWFKATRRAASDAKDVGANVFAVAHGSTVPDYVSPDGTVGQDSFVILAKGLAVTERGPIGGSIETYEKDIIYLIERANQNYFASPSKDQ